MRFEALSPQLVFTAKDRDPIRMDDHEGFRTSQNGRLGAPPGPLAGWPHLGGPLGTRGGLKLAPTAAPPAVFDFLEFQPFLIRPFIKMIVSANKRSRQCGREVLTHPLEHFRLLAATLPPTACLPTRVHDPQALSLRSGAAKPKRGDF
jgi:hypothetical protein